jgi:dipeptidyl aminopeptidase/acylaminoacyl peptidase
MFFSPLLITRRLWAYKDAPIIRHAFSSAVLLAFSTAFSGFGIPRVEPASSGQSPSRRPVTVTDAIEMTRLADPDYFNGLPSQGRVAHFSPDGRRFVILLREGNLEHNINDVSLILYETADIFRSPKPNLLLKMSSSSNRGAITNIRWFEDSETLGFLGENPNEAAQVYTLNVRTGLLRKITNHPTAITSFDISKDGREVIFAAERQPRKKLEINQERNEGRIITTSSLEAALEEALLGEQLYGDNQLFLLRSREGTVEVPIGDRINYTGPISISPDGRFALVAAWARDVPSEWMDYRDERVRTIVASHRKGELALLTRYLLLDTKNCSLTPLLNAPMSGFPKFVWGSNSQSVSLKTYLPLDIVDPAERERRTKEEIPVEVRLQTRELRRITEEELTWEIVGANRKLAGIEVNLSEDMNTPPKIYASDLTNKKKVLLLDLNPQFSELNLGKVEKINWRATDGEERTGGLFLPADYEAGKRYPLVIQTHGFNSERFSMDGVNEWSSAFAARMLAAKRVLVLQMGGIRLSGDSSEGASYMAAVEGAIDDLDEKGLIDRNKIGISGFSRTVYEVGYVLTHSKYKFRSAILVDGITGGYLDYLAWGDDTEPALNGGSPFGDQLTLWLKNSPGFNLNRVSCPVRLVALGPGSVLEMWEWFAGLRLQNKPVDFIEIPAVHLLQRPWDRRIAMQGIVDWYSFWLQGEEDPDPPKANQYARWQELRKEYAAGR